MRTIQITLITFSLLLGTSPCLADGKLDLMFGGFTINASTDNGSGSMSGIGSYLVAYRYPLSSSLELGLGYSLNATETFGGDLGYGPDLGLSYFPVTTTQTTEFRNADTSVRISPLWRPYFSLSFHQRQFQSTQSSYGGFGLAVGGEYQWRPDLSLKAEVRALGLSGPSNSKATEFDGFVGISLPL
ncbi:hypothetical protein [Bdellovibrio bacteriovorus]|uniref:hypothetical protein n=1 Tax=Bdellovibrio bacteriovorus TaxID=959 RepID=UPI0035A6F395